jgi:hypothetical protein
MPKLSGKKRKAPETPADAEDDSDKPGGSDSSGASATSKPDRSKVDGHLKDDSTVVLEGDALPSDLHESGHPACHGQSQDYSKYYPGKTLMLTKLAVSQSSRR